jgi:hypothetical protein
VTPTGGVITRTIVGTGTENGIAYIDIRYQASAIGNAFVSFEATNFVAATPGQVWSASAYVKLVGGAYTGITQTDVDITPRDAALVALADNLTVFTATTAALSTQRITTTHTMPATTAWISAATRIIGSGAFDITLRIGLPQLELGAFATSVIPTTTTALTRSADVASVNTLSPWYNSAASTIYGEWTPIAATMPTGATQVIAIFNDTTANNTQSLFQIQAASTKASANMLSGGVNPGRLDSGGAYSNATAKAAAAFAASDRAISANGTVATTSTSGALPASITRLELGGNSGFNYLNGYLRRITYYPRRLTNLELQTITLPAGATITTQEYSLDTNFIGNTVAIGS